MNHFYFFFLTLHGRITNWKELLVTEILLNDLDFKNTDMPGLSYWFKASKDWRWNNYEHPCLTTTTTTKKSSSTETLYSSTGQESVVVS